MAGQRIFSVISGGSADPYTIIGRAGSEAISNGAQTHTVTFSAAMVDINYAVIPSLYNSTDVDPSYLTAVVTQKTVNGFTVEFNAPVDSANYVLDYIASRFT